MGAFTLTARSDCVCTVVDTLETLFVVFGSGVVDVTVEVFVRTVSQATFGLMRTVITKPSPVPPAIVGAVQVTVPFVFTAGVVQMKPGGVVFETKTVPGGSVVVKLTLAAALALTFVML